MLPLIRGRLYLRFLHLATEPVYRGHSKDDWHSHAQARDILYEQGNLFLIITGDSSYLDIDHYITKGVGIPGDSLDGDLLEAHGKFVEWSHSHLAHISIFRRHGIALGSTVNQHSPGTRRYRCSPHSMVPTSGRGGHHSSREDVILCCLLLGHDRHLGWRRGLWLCYYHLGGSATLCSGTPVLV